MSSDFALDAGEFHRRKFEEAAKVVAGGIQPGVTSWCGRCQAITPLVPEGCGDASEAIQLFLHRWGEMSLWMH